MARRSVDSRMDRILAKLLPPGSRAWREWHLSDDMKEALLSHETKVARIISEIEKRDGPGGSFARLIAGDLTLPQMPQSLRQALGLVDPPPLTEDMSLSEIGDVYRQLVEGDT